MTLTWYRHFQRNGGLNQIIGQREAYLTGQNTDKVSLIGQRDAHLTGHNTDKVSIIGQREAHLTGHNTDKYNGTFQCTLSNCKVMMI